MLYVRFILKLLQDTFLIKKLFKCNTSRKVINVTSPYNYFINLAWAIILAVEFFQSL